MDRSGWPFIQIEHALSLPDARASREAVTQMTHTANLLPPDVLPVYHQVAVIGQRWDFRRAVLHVRRCWDFVGRRPQITGTFLILSKKTFYQFFHGGLLDWKITVIVVIMHKLIREVVLSVPVKYLGTLCVSPDTLWSSQLSKESAKNDRIGHFERRFLHAVYEVLVILQVFRFNCDVLEISFHIFQESTTFN